MLFRYVELNALKAAEDSDSRQMVRCFVVDLSSPGDSSAHPTVVTLHTSPSEVILYTSLPSSPSTISQKALEAEDAALFRHSQQQQRTVLVRKNDRYLEAKLLPLDALLSTTDLATTCGILVKVMPPRQCSKGDYLCTIYLVDESSLAPVIVTVFAAELAKLEIFTVALRGEIDCSASDRPFFSLRSMSRSTRTKSLRARRRAIPE